MQASFKLDEEQEYQYQMEMPQVQGPEAYLEMNEILRLQLKWASKMSRLMSKPAKWVCAQQRLRSAWASAQSDQSLRCPQEESLAP